MRVNFQYLFIFFPTPPILLPFGWDGKEIRRRKKGLVDIRYQVSGERSIACSSQSIGYSSQWWVLRLCLCFWFSIFSTVWYLIWMSSQIEQKLGI